jgi:hypothetical protein
MFIETVDCVRHVLGEPQLARDIGAALAARLDQIMRDLSAVLQNVGDALEAPGKLPMRARMREHEAQNLGQALADMLEIALEREIVGQIELADARGVAAAAKIFQQNRIVKIVERRAFQPDRAPDMNADPAGAHAMAGGLAFGQVERVAEGAQDFRETDIRGGRFLIAHALPKIEPGSAHGYGEEIDKSVPGMVCDLLTQVHG